MTQDAEVNIRLNEKEARKRLDDLQKQADDLRKKFDECFKKGDTKGVQRASEQLNRVNKQIANIKTSADGMRSLLLRLDEATPKELQQALKAINRELNSGRVQRGTKEWAEYCEQAKKVKAALTEINAEMAPDREEESWVEKFNSFAGKWGGVVASITGTFAGVTVAAKSAYNEFVKMDSQMADTQKFTGMTREEVERLNEEFKKMDTRTSREQLNELASAAGRLGKNSVEDVLEFVRAGNIITVAMDEIGNDAPQVIAQLASIFNLESKMGTERSMLSVGSAINTLSQNCAASAPNLVEFASRMGAVANQTHMSIDQMLAFGALLDDQKVSMEKASTAMQGVITKMYADSAGFAKTVGLDVEKFTAALKRSSTEGIMMFVEALSSMDQMQQAKTLKDLGTAGAGVVQTFQTLAGKVGALQTQLETSKQAFQEASSATEEYDVQNNTIEAGIDKAKKEFTELAISLGDKLQPAMKFCISSTSMLMKTISALVSFVSEYYREILAAAAGVGLWTLAIKYNTIEQKLSNVAHTAWNGILKVTRPLVAAMQLAYFKLTGNVEGATAAQNRLTAAQLRLNAAMKANMIGVIITLITTAYALISRYVRKTKEAAEEQERLAAEQKKAYEGLRDYSENQIKYANEETKSLKKLYEAATNDKLAKEQRLKAAKALQRMYPDYFKNLSTEYIMIGSAKDKYDELCTSIEKTARARAGMEKIQENESQSIDVDIKLNKKEKEYGNQKKYLEQLHFETTQAKAKWSNHSERTLGISSSSRATREESRELRRLWQEAEQRENDLRTKMKDTANEIYELKQEQTRLKEANNDIKESAGITDEMMQQKTIEEELNDIVFPTITPTGESNGKDKDPLKEKLDEVKAFIDQQQAYNTIAYATGEKDYAAYLDRKRVLDIAYIDSQMEVYEEAGMEESAQYADLMMKRSDIEQKWAKDQQQASLESLEKGYQEMKKLAIDAYADENNALYLNDQAYKQALFQAEVVFLQKKLDLYRGDAEEREKIERELNEKLKNDKVEKAKETREKREAFEKKYLAKFGQEYKEKYAEIDKLETDGVITHEEATRAKYKELSSYLKSIGQEFAGSLLDLYDAIKQAIDGEGGATEIVLGSLATMQAAMSQYSSFVNAERDIEISRIEEKYDKEIEAAGSNSKKIEKLEKQKEEDIAKVKKKYNDKAMKIEIAQAIAQTAQAAINAYSSAAAIPVTGFVMAPIAAALATAAGMVQIATIKKQHQAEAAGYYEGGFTGGSRYRREAGVVHEGEFVANHNAVNNKSLSPVLRLIDQAQKSNTVGSLTSEDVQRAIGSPSAVAALQPAQPTIVTNDIDTSSISRLGDIIEGGIEAYVVLDGEQGLDKKYTNFKKLKENPKR